MTPSVFSKLSTSMPHNKKKCKAGWLHSAINISLDEYFIPLLDCETTLQACFDNILTYMLCVFFSVQKQLGGTRRKWAGQLWNASSPLNTVRRGSPPVRYDQSYDCDGDYGRLKKGNFSGRPYQFVKGFRIEIICQPKSYCKNCEFFPGHLQGGEVWH